MIIIIQFQLIKCISSHFPGTLEKLYILNPSGTLNFSWKIIESMNLYVNILDFIDEKTR